MSENKTGEPVRAALVGLTGWGEHAISAIGRASPSVELALGCDMSEAARAAFTSKYGVSAVPDLQAVLDDPRIEAVFLVTPNFLHEDMVTRAARAGKHVFVEKPIAATVAEARAMIAACREAGVILMVGHNTRRHAGHRKMKELLDSGALGTIVLAEANFSHGGGMGLTGTEWRASRQLCPAAPLMQLGVHQADTLQYLLGDVGAVSSLMRHVATPVDIDDSTVSLLRFDSGPLGTLTSNYACENAFFIHLHGTKGLAYCHYGNELSVRLHGKSEFEKVPLEAVDTMAEEVAEFARCVRTGETPETDGVAGLKALAIVEAAILSAANNGCAVPCERP